MYTFVDIYYIFSLAKILALYYAAIGFVLSTQFHSLSQQYICSAPQTTHHIHYYYYFLIRSLVHPEFIPWLQERTNVIKNKKIPLYENPSEKPHSHLETHTHEQMRSYSVRV